MPPLEPFLKRLASDRWQDRQDAEQDLIKMGEDARPFIAELRKREAGDREVRTRLEAALSQIDDNRVLGPSFITLHLKDATARTVFEELSKQCYAKFSSFPDNLLEESGLPKVTIDVDRQPFWTAMRQIATKTGIDLQQYNDGMRLMRGGFRMNSQWSVVQGPFLIVPVQLNRSQTMMLANGGGSSSSFSLQMTAYSEPKLHVLSSNSAVIIDQAVDDAGNSLIATGMENRGYYGGGGGSWNLYAQLHYPDHPGKKIARLRGHAAFVIQTKSEKLQIDNLKTVHDSAHVIGGMPVIIHEIKKNGDNWDLRLTANAGTTPDAWNQLNQSVQNRLQILDAQGQSLDHRGMGSRGENNKIEFTLTFAASVRPNDGRSSTEPVKLIWDIPTASKQISLPFEFKDLPMTAK